MAARKFDPLKMFFGRPFDVGNGMTLYIPTLGDILELENSDQTFYQTLYIWVANPTMYRLMLWENGVDWNKVSDYELFLMLYKTENPDVTRMLFGDDIKLKEFDIYLKSFIDKDEDGNDVEKSIPTLYNAQSEIEISQDDYNLIASYYRTAFNIHPKVEKAKGRATKEVIIEEERMKLAQKQKEEAENDSSLLPLVSSCINHPGFKYNLQELEDVNFVQFMDSVQRLQIYENTTALIKGSYSGMIDTSKINKEEFNWMRDMSHK